MAACVHGGGLLPKGVLLLGGQIGRAPSARKVMSETDRQEELHPRRSGQPEPVRVHVVGMWRRLTAFVVDLLLLILPVVLTGAAVFYLTDLQPPRGALRVEGLVELLLWGGAPLYTFVGIVVALLYLYDVVFLCLLGATPGMRLVGCEVIDIYGGRPHGLRVSLRFVGLLLAWASLGVGVAWIGIDREKRGWHDWLAGTFVVRSAKATGRATRLASVVPPVGRAMG